MGFNTLKTTLVKRDLDKKKTEAVVDTKKQTSTNVSKIFSKQQNQQQYQQQKIDSFVNNAGNSVESRLQKDFTDFFSLAKINEEKGLWYPAMNYAVIAAEAVGVLIDGIYKPRGGIPSEWSTKQSDVENMIATLRDVINDSSVSGGVGSGKRLLQGGGNDADGVSESCANMIEISFKKGSKDCATSWFSQIVGLRDVKASLPSKIIDPFLFPSLRQNKTKGILLYGPPGTGKTLMAKACANELMKTYVNADGTPLVKIFFYAPTPSMLKSSYFGGSEAKIAGIFRCASNAAKDWEKTRKTPAISIIFIDELDSIAPSRSDDKNASITVNALLQEIGGVKDNSNVVVIGATNRPDSLDDAILQRLNSQIYIGLPDGNKQTGKEATSYTEIKQLLDMRFNRMVRETLKAALNPIARPAVGKDEVCVYDNDFSDTNYQWNGERYAQYFSINDGQLYELAAQMHARNFSNRLIDDVFDKAQEAAAAKARMDNIAVGIPHPLAKNSEKMYFCVDCLSDDYLMNVRAEDSFVFKPVSIPDMRFKRADQTSAFIMTNSFWRRLFKKPKEVRSAWLYVEQTEWTEAEKKILAQIAGLIVFGKDYQEGDDVEALNLIEGKPAAGELLSIDINDPKSVASAKMLNDSLKFEFERVKNANFPDEVITLLENALIKGAEGNLVFLTIINYKRIRLLRNLRAKYHVLYEMDVPITFNSKNTTYKKSTPWRTLSILANKNGISLNNLLMMPKIAIINLLKTENVKSDEIQSLLESKDLNSNSITRHERLWIYKEVSLNEQDKTTILGTVGKGIKKAASTTFEVLTFRAFTKKDKIQTRDQNEGDLKMLSQKISEERQKKFTMDAIMKDSVVFTKRDDGSIVYLEWKSLPNSGIQKVKIGDNPITNSLFMQNWWQESTEVEAVDETKLQNKITLVVEQPQEKTVDYEKAKLYTNWNITYEQLSAAIQTIPDSSTVTNAVLEKLKTYQAASMPLPEEEINGSTSDSDDEINSNLIEFYA